MMSCLTLLLGWALANLAPAQETQPSTTAQGRTAESRPVGAAFLRRRAALEAGTPVRQTGRSFAYGARRPATGPDGAAAEPRAAAGARAADEPRTWRSGRSFK